MIEDRTEAQIDILLATYNGAAFLEEQIGSILQQSHRNWRLLVRDDGSTDRTPEIIRQAADDHPEKIVLISDNTGNLGYAGNFSRLMAQSSADYLAFCDQDDVWLSNKLALSMDKMRQLERLHGKSAPLLVHSDLKVVDHDLDEISPSFWGYQGLDPVTSDKLNRLLVQNVITGCAALMNRPLMELSLPIPAEAKAHDWWIALVAAALGAVGHIDEPTILYRQHGQNSIGAKAFGEERFVRRVLRFFRTLPESRDQFRKTFAQAAALRRRHGAALSSKHADLLQDFLAIPGSGPMKRLYYSRKWRVLPPHVGFEIAYAIVTHGLPPQQTVGSTSGGSCRPVAVSNRIGDNEPR